MGRGIRRNRNRQPRGSADNGGGGRVSQAGPGGGDQSGQGIRGAGYKDILRENEAFEAFYKAQGEHGLYSDAGEFERMMASFKTDLPASFRITGFRSQAMVLRDLVKSRYMSELAAASKVEQEERQIIGQDEVEPGSVVTAAALPWYPDEMAWQMNLTRKIIRRQEAYFKLHNFLISETESGNICRQETVSMIPPLVLDVQPHHKVLDMCAAPGSKTAQLVEALHKVAEDVLPTGVVVANDCDNARCYMLAHQVKRLQSPCLIIVNHDASNMPNFRTSTGGGGDLKFDRILCDVPCSGDGTLRKNADLWLKWNAAIGLGLHGLQYRILKRGLELLEVGGRLVYSTCSLNPVEDEAVLHRMLNESEGSVEIVDISGQLKGLKFMPGMSRWKVATKERGMIFSKFSEVPEKLKSQLRPGLFAPEGGADPGLHLERCIRILPHLQDTGGFFVAVLTKTALCPWESDKEANGKANNIDRKGREPPRKKPRFQGYKEDPFMYLQDGDATFEEVKSYFSLSDVLESKMFLTRCKDTAIKNSLYFTSPLLRDLIQSNVNHVKVINAGIKAFAKCENKGASCRFRLAQEGAQITIPFLGQRIVRPTKKDLQVLLVKDDIDKPPALSEMDESTLKQLEGMDTGSVAFVFQEEDLDAVPKGDEEGKPGLKLELVGWKGKESVRAYVPKNERIHYLRLLGGDTSKYETNKFEVKRKAEEGQTATLAEPAEPEGQAGDAGVEPVHEEELPGQVPVEKNLDPDTKT